MPGGRREQRRAILLSSPSEHPSGVRACRFLARASRAGTPDLYRRDPLGDPAGPGRHRGYRQKRELRSRSYAKGFQVFEDNKEQSLVSFSAGTDQTIQANGQRRYLILFFDNSTMG